MEFVGVIIAYFVIQVVWNLITNSFRENEYEKEQKNNIFTTKVIEDSILMEDDNWGVLNIKMKGIINCPTDNTSVKYMVQLMEISDGKKFIYSTYEDFQYEDTIAFQYESKSELLPYKGTIFKDWSEIVKIPIMFLEFPRQGTCKLEAKIFVIDTRTDYILAENTTVFTYNNLEKGYLDRKDNRKYFEEMIIKSAMLVSASDGDMDDGEASIIRSWIQKRLSLYNEDEQPIEKARLNSYVKDIYQEIETGDDDIIEVLDGIENITTEGEKFELFQLCLDVAQADGTADEAELEMVHNIADHMKLDRKQFRSMIEKTLPVTIHASEADDATLLGIDQSMSNKEVKKHLREQYQKWNARVASSDPATREQAEKMINLIAEARKKYT